MSANVCSGCGASLSRSRFICQYCGRTTDLAIKTSEDEFELLREIARAAQKIGGEGASNESLEAFWQAAPLPRFPEPLAQACREALAGVTGAWDIDHGVMGGQVALFSRAEACVASLTSHPGHQKVVDVLLGQLEKKRHLAHRPVYKTTGFWIAVFLLVAAGLWVWFVALKF